MTLTCLNARHIKNWIHKREGEVRKQAEQIACITAKNAPDLLQVLNFTGLLPFVNKLQETCQIHQVATSMLNQACSNLSICGFVGRFAKTTCSKPLDNNNQRAASLLTTSKRIAIRLSGTCFYIENG